MRPTIAFLTGGYSAEAEISYKSALTIEQNLDTELWDVYKIDIREEGWNYNLPSGEQVKIDKNDFSLVLNEEKVNFDAVFIGIHGTPGEDGKLQGYFDLMHIPYTSCDAATSALTFNKRFTVAVASFAGIPVAKSIHLFNNRISDNSAILEELNLPVFVKPNNGGSSIGMSKVNSKEDLTMALDKAFKEDTQVLIEEYIHGREFTIGVYRSKGAIITLPITEVKSKKDFFDFEAKYHGASEEVTPADVDKFTSDQIKSYASKAYDIFNCKGIVRIDFIYNEKMKLPYMLEINTIPGQSEASIIPQQVKAAGITLKDFYSSLIEECLHGNSY